MPLTKAGPQVSSSEPARKPPINWTPPRVIAQAWEPKLKSRIHEIEATPSPTRRYNIPQNLGSIVAMSPRRGTLTSFGCPLGRERWARPIVALLALLMAAPLAAQPASDAWRVRVDSGAVHRWDTDIDAGGDLEVDTWAIRVGADRSFSRDLRLGLSAGYEERRYAFGGGDGFGALRPWSDVRDLRLSGRFSWKASERWDLFAVPTARWFADEDASLSDGLSGGLLAAASYRFNDRLSIGPGFGVLSEIEGSNDWFPILAIDWAISDTLSLRTGSGFAATQGPGLVLNWRPSERWGLALGARYEKARFRLDDQGIAPGGVGQETSVPVYLGATRSFSRHLSLSLIAGVEFGGELRLEDEKGRLIDKTDFDTAPFGGATLDLRF